VAELEKEVRAMRSLLNKSKQSPSGDSNHDSNHGSNGTVEEKEEIDGFLQEGPLNNVTMPSEPMKEPTWPCGTAEGEYANSDVGAERTPDVIERDLIGLAMAQEYFDHYVNNMIQHVPIVAFRPEDTADSVRSKKPILFLTILTAVAGQKNHSLYITLHEELLQIFADRYIINCDKSLELVQSFLLTAVWLYPPNDFRSLKFYQYLHMAASMALDIGQPDLPGAFARYQWPTDISDSFMKTSAHESFKKMADTYPPPAFSGNNNPPQNLRQELLVLESKRTHLACYLLCARYFPRDGPMLGSR
jgi:hypothetical protein